MPFSKLNELFKEVPDVSTFFSHDPLHGFTVSQVMQLTQCSNYREAYDIFVEKHWKNVQDIVVNAVKDVAEEVVESVTEAFKEEEETSEVVKPAVKPTNTPVASKTTKPVASTTK